MNLSPDRIEPQNPPWWRVLESGDKIVNRVERFQTNCWEI